MGRIAKTTCNGGFFNFRKVYVQDLLSEISSYVTDRFPRLGGFAVNGFIGLIYNRFVVSVLAEFDRRVAKSVRNPRNIAVISDLNIGDAINLQGVIFVLKKVFPKANVDYIVNRSAKEIIEFNPNVRSVFGVLTYDAETSKMAIKKIIDSIGYDLVVNLCPFIERIDIVECARTPYIGFNSLVGRIVYNEIYSSKINHVSYQAYKHFCELFVGGVLDCEFVPALWLSDEAIVKAKSFLRERELSGGKAFVLFNPDATSKYTQIPFPVQVDILDRLCRSKEVERIFVTSCYTFSGFENKLSGALNWCRKIDFVPKDTPLDVYAALIDQSSVFVTSDTGTMHIAAAKKFDCKNRPLCNRTAIFTVFGATSARMYGYSSFDSGFLDSYQDAPAFLYVSDAPCRNITCNNKKAKICSTLKCFDGVDGDKIAEDIIRYMSCV